MKKLIFFILLACINIISFYNTFSQDSRWIFIAYDDDGNGWYYDNVSIKQYTSVGHSVDVWIKIIQSRSSDSYLRRNIDYSLWKMYFDCNGRYYRIYEWIYYFTDTEEEYTGSNNGFKTIIYPETIHEKILTTLCK